MKKQYLKSLLALVMVSLMTLSILSACGSNEVASEDSTAAETSAAETTQETKEEPVNLSVINYRVEDQAFYDEFNAAFEKKYPHITVKYDAIATKDYPTLKAARIAANEVDVIGSGTSEIRDKAVREQYLDLKDQPFVNNYIKDALELCKYNNELLVLPMNSVSFVTFYNKKLFSDNGIAVPTTWAEFVKACETFKSKGIAPVMFGGKDQWPINMVIGQFEASIVRPALPDFWTKSLTEENKFTDAPWIEVFTKLKQLSLYLQENSSGLAYGQAPGLFAQGKAAMMIDGSWSGSQITAAKPSFEVGTFLLPASDIAENNKTAATKIGSGFAIYKESKNVDAALKYLDFMSTKENYSKYIEFVKMDPVQPELTISDPVSKEIAALLSKQIPEFELVFKPGGKYEFTNYGMQLFYSDATPEEIAQKFQKDLIDSKPTWAKD